MTGCRCWECRKRGGLRTVAPRLTAAYFDTIRVARERAILRAKLLEAERLVAHRELQLTRSESNRRARRDRGYMRQRQHKLERAKRAVEAVRIQMARLA